MFTDSRLPEKVYMMSYTGSTTCLCKILTRITLSYQANIATPYTFYLVAGIEIAITINSRYFRWFLSTRTVKRPKKYSDVL